MGIFCNLLIGVPTTLKGHPPPIRAGRRAY